MTSPAKQPAKKGGWGSLLSGAVANLESRLDTILAEDGEASARERAAEKAAKEARSGTANSSGNLEVPSRQESVSGSRDASKTRANDRLAERLAKATAHKTASQVSSSVPSRVASPANSGAEGVRTSGESTRPSTDIARSVPDAERATETAGTALPGNIEVGAEDIAQPPPVVNGTLSNSSLPINPARSSRESARASVELTSNDASPSPPSELSNGTAPTPDNAVQLDTEMSRLREDHAQAEKQRTEEMHAYLEKIDALQAKLQYLAKETVAAAKEANAATSAGSDAAKLAEKDERIALLMEEGEKLSKTELRHMQTIKKLRAKSSEDEKAAAEVRKKLDRVEKAEADLKQKLRWAETAGRQANEKTKQIAAIEKQVDELRVNRDKASESIRSLTSQLKEANEKAARAESDASSKAGEIDRARILSLESELEDVRLEKKLAQERAVGDVNKAREEMERQQQRFSLREVEFKNEIASLESRLEAMRYRAEEASSENVNDGASVKLMRQVETLQSQYSLAKDNWETIESSLNARVSALEKERDDATRREADLRKKAREVGVRSRKAEEELEVATEQAQISARESKNLQSEINTAQSKLDQVESVLTDARAEFERQRIIWQSELNQRIDEEKIRWQRGLLGPANPASPLPARKISTPDSPAVPSSTARRPMNHVTSHNLTALHTQTDPPRPLSSRRGSAMPPSTSAYSFHGHPFHNSTEASPTISRNESTTTLDTPVSTSIPPTPSVEVDADFSNPDSPQRTINDLVSTSAAGAAAGPSVQLVERLSLAVRRLESEKASSRDELLRLAAQRDEARTEVVSLMREVETKRAAERSAESVEAELREVRRRYDASLEMLGEREEEVQELKQDVQELKTMYRQLVETKVGPAK